MDSCVICLESLSSKPLGAAAPCGHVCHVECFEEWAKSRRRCGSLVKCPSCNNASTQFLRIYIDLDAVAANQDSDVDDQSLSSDDEEAETDNSAAEPRDENENVIIIHDSPVIQRKKSETDKLGKYRKMAKTFKKRTSILEEIRRDLSKEKQMILEKLAQKQAELNGANAELEELEDDFNEQSRCIEELKLKTVQHRRQLDECKMKIREYEQQTDHLNRKLKEIEKQYERRSANQLKEVQQMLEAQPKIVNENKQLKDKIRKLEQKLQTFQTNDNRSDFHDGRNAVKLLREVNRERQKHKQQLVQVTNQQEKDQLQKKQMEKLSKNTVRLTQAISKKQRPTLSGLNVLDSIDNSKRSKSSLLEPELPPFLKTVPSKRKPIHQNPSLLPPQRQRVTSAAQPMKFLFSNI